VVRRLFAVIVIAAAGAAGAYVWLDTRTSEEFPPIQQEDPAPGSPPVVWVSGTLAEIVPESIEVREGDGPTVRIQRFAEGATRFFLPAHGEWRPLGDRAVARIGPGREVCVEVLLDDQRMLGLRVFLDTRCAPVP
jgi:hypothetical protein